MKALIFISLLLTPPALRALSVYPKTPPVRVFGSNQGRVGSCQAEAEIAALEHTFANLGLPVRLSLFHRHAKLTQLFPIAKQLERATRFTTDDANVLNASGGVIPEYMWPENGEGFDPHFVGEFRPSIAEQALIDPSFPRAETLGFARLLRPLDPREFRAQVVAGAPVVLDVHGAMFFQSKHLFDHATGLTNGPEVTDALRALCAQETTHAVAVVGLDDELGAYIVRNSWNTRKEIERTSTRASTPEGNAALAKFRLKISRRNLPGYYALPYAYVEALAAKGGETYTLLTLDFPAFFAAYERFRPMYRTRVLPFSCEGARARGALAEYARARRRADFAREPERAQLMADTLAPLLETAANGERRLFSYARLPESVNGGPDRASQFYAGAFSKYYCGHPALRASTASLWPGSDLQGLRAQNSGIEAALAALSGEGRSHDIEAWRAWFDALVKTLNL